MDDDDEHAKNFDSLMYGIMLAQIEASPQFDRGKRQPINISASLGKRASIPQVNEKSN